MNITKKKVFCNLMKITGVVGWGSVTSWILLGWVVVEVFYNIVKFTRKKKKFCNMMNITRKEIGIKFIKKKKNYPILVIDLWKNVLIISFYL